MGGGNAQKSAAARLKNMKEAGPSKEQLAAAKAKADKDKAAFKCLICLQTFTISTKPAGLFLHVKSKHDKEEKTPEKCFPCLKGFDPDAKAAPAAGGGGGIKVAQGAAKKKVSKKKDADDLSALLADGLKVGKKKK
mmetsp:Transcript_22178/g.68391  ORF Transcript_22178/g.68391 Transcript_22178/m.68391 type:complete len:136 (+) Transcript_22178:216-623(+)